MPSAWTLVQATIGGVLIGLAASAAWILYGRIAGISGILARAISPHEQGDDGATFRIGFLEGLVGTGIAIAYFAPTMLGRPLRGNAALAIGGILVGVGTTLANGCTSGHGVCGLARFSKRSAVAVVTFMISAGVTVAIAGAGA